MEQHFERKTNYVRQNVLPLTAAFLWGTTFLAQSIAAEHIGPFTFNASRAVIAFVALSLLCLIRLKISGRSVVSSWRDLIIGGSICGAAMSVAGVLQQTGIATSTVGKAGFITTLYIVIVPIMGLFVGRKIRPAIWISLVLAVVGLYLLSVTGEFRIERGDFFLILCAFCFAVHIMVVDHFSHSVDGIALSCMQFPAMFVITFSGAILTREYFSVSELGTCAGAVLYAGVFSSAVAFTLQILAQKDSNPTIVSLLMSLESVFAALSGVLFNNERMTMREICGCVLMFTAVVITQLPEKNKPDLEHTEIEV